MIVYFSATGNSRHCADMLAELLSDERIDCAEYLKDKSKARNFTSNKPWVFVCPTYAWRIPAVFERFILSAAFSGSRDAYFVMTCGGDIGNSAAYNKELCGCCGLTCKGTFETPMPENYIVMFDAPDEAKCTRMISEAESTLSGYAQLILRGAQVNERKAGLLDRFKSGPVNLGFNKFQITDKGFTVSDSCTGCGKCERLCPLGNISIKDNKPVWNGSCTHCMACISYCPVSAIDIGKATKGKRRYTFPDKNM